MLVKLMRRRVNIKSCMWDQMGTHSNNSKGESYEMRCQEEVV